MPAETPTAPETSRWAPVQLWLATWREFAPEAQRKLQLAAVVMLIGSLLSALVPVIVGEFVQTLVKPGHSASLSRAAIPLSVLGIVMASISGLETWKHQLIHTVTTGFQSDARQKVYAALMRWDLVRYVEGARAAIYGRANRSVEGAERLIKLGAGDLLPAITVALFAVVVAIVRYGVVGVVIAIVIPTGFGLVAMQVRSQSGIRVDLARTKEQIDGEVGAWLGLIDVIRPMGAEKFFDGLIGERCAQLRKIELRHHIAMSKYDAAKTINEVVWMIAMLLVTVVVEPHISAAQLTALILLYWAVTTPLRQLHRIIDEGSESALQARDLREDLDVTHDVSYLATTPAPADPTDTNAITLTDVRFSFPQGDGEDVRLVLGGLSLSIHKGERIAIVGRTGCGKSTVLRLLARLVHGWTGAVLINGRPLSNISREELVTTLGYVPQQSQLFSGTIRENILIGREDITDEEIARACSRANIHTDIAQMPLGYETPVGEDGAKLSGGQRQRLCLARALLRTPPILLLDEPTSALDGPSEAVVQQAIDALEDVTVVVVAHRLHTLRNMDRIVVLANGAIVEQGPYNALEAAGGVFAGMLNIEPRDRAERAAA